LSLVPDNLTQEQRSYCMSRNRGKDTNLEVTVRSALHRRGLRFRKHVSGLPGRPDVVFPKAKIAVFLDGDFWHGYQYEKWKDTLSSFWRQKISRTIERDLSNHRKLKDMGWMVMRLWEHEVEDDFEGSIERIVTAVNVRVP